MQLKVIGKRFGIGALIGVLVGLATVIVPMAWPWWVAFIAALLALAALYTIERLQDSGRG